MGVSLLVYEFCEERDGPFAGRAGQSTLSLVFFIGTITVIMGTTLALLVFSFLSSSSAFQVAQRANAVATAGAEDALLRLARNKDFADSIGYTVLLGSDTARVVVVQNMGIHQATITSEAAVANRRRVLEVLVSIASSTGQINVFSWKQI